MFLHYVVINVLLSILDVFLTLYSGIYAGYAFLIAAIDAVLLALWYFVIPFKKHKANEKTLRFYLIFSAVVFIMFTLISLIKGGNMTSVLHLFMFIPLLPFLPFALLIFLSGPTGWITIGLILIIHCVLLSIKNEFVNVKKLALVTLPIILICTVYSVHIYVNRDSVKYAPHGFDYMNGFSSTDFTDYMVYSKPSKLVTLDHEPEFMIENEKDMPVLDGAEACYPVYSAVAKALYKDIDKIELNNTDDKYNGKIVTFTNTVNGYYRLADGRCDMLFGARPSQDQLAYAKEVGVEYRMTMIGKEAFVFFVEADNPVDNLTTEQMKAIYHGDITNWKEVGGPNQQIIAFQRPEGSGSQTMMIYFMGDVSLKEPKTYETYNAMSGIVKNVANYANEDGALGYSFRYFIEGLMQEKNVKILSIDGVYPTTENIKNGSYPLVTGLYCVTRENDPNEYVEKVLDFLLSEDGQYIIEKTGYVGLNN